MVAYLAENLMLNGGERVLEIGTGSGYQAAVLAKLVSKVYTIERIADLANHAQTALQKLGLDNVEMMTADGALGWVEKAPFDRILLTAAAGRMPKRLLMGANEQEIVRLTRDSDQFKLERLRDCSFVPLVREHSDAGTAEALTPPELQ
jgi:protein-L-isoaspartate(D-aspartate) O-methyltransferase